jgi:hypothetical protein
MTRQRIWLDVPFAEKDQAKALGARWDTATKRWYALGNEARFARWISESEIPELLAGEDRSFGEGLFVDMVPSSCWFTNVRSCVSPKDWERLRRMLTRRAGQRCEICGQREEHNARRWLEAHERWSYDESGPTQILRRLICLCTDCHTTTHFGLAGLHGKANEARAHLCKVTGMSMAQANEHIRNAWAVWEERSKIHWSLSLDLLTAAAGIQATPPPPAAERASIVKEKLR